MTREDAIRKIKSLLSLASSSNENEASQALSAARRLMLKFQVEESSLQTEEMTIRELSFVSTRVQTWEVILANAIARHFNTTLTYVKDSKIFNIYGSCLDTEIAAHAIDGTRNRLLVLLEEAKKSRPSNENPKAFRTSWLFGAAVAIDNRLRDVEERSSESSSKEETSLVLRSIHRAEEFLARTTPRVIRAHHDLTFASGSGYFNGKATGSSLEIVKGLSS